MGHTVQHIDSSQDCKSYFTRAKFTFGDVVGQVESSRRAISIDSDLPDDI